MRTPPPEVLAAARLITEWTAQNNIKEFAIDGIQQRVFAPTTMTYDPDDIEARELAAFARWQAQRDARLMRHPDCRDPDHPGCERCYPEDVDPENPDAD